MKECKTIKGYADRLIDIANKVRLLGTTLADSRILLKILVTMPKRYEALINTLEITKDLFKISLTDVIHAWDQRRLMGE